MRNLWRLQEIRSIQDINRRIISDYTDGELYDRIRLNHETFQKLCGVLLSHMRSRSARNNALTHEERIYIALYFFACGSFQKVVGDSIGVDKSTVCRAVTEVTNAILKVLPTFVSTRFFDRPENLSFFEQKHLPNVTGAIDGTHIKIISPAIYENEYVNRKGYHSLNIQVIGTGEMLVADIVADWPGGTHDSRILRESGIFHKFENDEYGNRILLGDQGYPLKTWLFTPITRSVLTVKEQRFNYFHKSARCSVERLFGIWKRRWTCLNHLRVNPRKAAKIIAACAVIHNFAILNGENGYLNNASEEDPVSGEITTHQVEESDSASRTQRAVYINEHF